MCYYEQMTMKSKINFFSMFSIFLRTFMNVHTPYTGHFETITNEAMKASKTLVYAYAKDLL